VGLAHRKIALCDVKIRSADAARGDAHAYLSRSRIGKGDVGEAEGALLDGGRACDLPRAHATIISYGGRRVAPVDFDAIVLAGGVSSRLGGADKAELEIGGRRLIDRVLDALGNARRVVVVGPMRPTTYPVTWTEETPRGSGPVHALAAGLEHVATDLFVLLAVDLPFVDSNAVSRLVDATGSADAAVYVDEEGRDQMLFAAYRTGALRTRLGIRQTVDAPVKELLQDLRVVRLQGAEAAADCDTWADIRAAEASLKR
jgi:molybdopterin-guanine dinucleotide biosynthesis protein A